MIGTPFRLIDAMQIQANTLFPCSLKRECALPFANAYTHTTRSLALTKCENQAYVSDVRARLAPHHSTGTRSSHCGPVCPYDMPQDRCSPGLPCSRRSR